MTGYGVVTVVLWWALVAMSEQFAHCKPPRFQGWLSSVNMVVTPPISATVSRPRSASNFSAAASY
jgi:hypothetical protein